MRSLYIYRVVLEYWRYRLIHLKIIHETTYVLHYVEVEVGEAFYVIRSAAYMHYNSTLSLALSLREREKENGRLRTGSTLEYRSTHTLDRN
jgi:hypothetical protein